MTKQVQVQVQVTVLTKEYIDYDYTGEEIIGVYWTPEAAKQAVPTAVEEEVRSWLRHQDNRPQGPLTIESREQWLQDCLACLHDDNEGEITVLSTNLANNSMYRYLTHYIFRYYTRNVQN